MAADAANHTQRSPYRTFEESSLDDLRWLMGIIFGALLRVKYGFSANFL